MTEQKKTSGCLVPVFLMTLILLIIWQSILIQRQIQEQSRIQFLDQIYSEAHYIVRQEAALAFIEIERERGKTANLREANLSRVSLILANLSEADLREANLRGANLMGTNLSLANLIGADLSLANLIGADFNGADLSGADLSGTDRTDLAYLAELSGLVDLSDETLTNLSGDELAKLIIKMHLGKVTQEQINSAQGDETTRLPSGLSRPEHWTKAEEGPPDEFKNDRELNRPEGEGPPDESDRE